MVEKVYQYMKKYHMFADCRHIIVGLSGGADSVCLLLMLHEIIRSRCLCVTLSAVHINHGIRGGEAARDEAFSCGLAQKLDVPFRSYHENVPAYAQKEGLSEEEAGRRVRYRIFYEEAQKQNVPVNQVRIAVAHHMDDQAETVLMNLFRGSGLRGLSGIQPVREHIIRPLLCLSRAQIEAWLAAHGQPYVTDSTNLENAYTRNQLRNIVIPYVQQHFNPNFVPQISATAGEMTQAYAYIHRQAQNLEKRCAVWQETGPSAAAEAVRKKGAYTKENTGSVQIMLSAFLQEEDIICREMLYHVLCRLADAQADIYRIHIDKLMELKKLQVGKQVKLPYGITAVRTYDSICLQCSKGGETDRAAGKDAGMVQQTAEQPAPKAVMQEIPKEALEALFEDEPGSRQLRVRVDSWIYVPDKGWCYAAEAVFEAAGCPDIFENNDYTKYFDYDKINADLCVRFRQAGDYIVVCANGNSHKFKKELIDRKILQACRGAVLLLARENEVLWAAGLRRSEAYRVCSTSARILKARFSIQEDE